LSDAELWQLDELNDVLIGRMPQSPTYSIVREGLTLALIGVGHTFTQTEAAIRLAFSENAAAHRRYIQGMATKLNALIQHNPSRYWVHCADHPVYLNKADTGEHLLSRLGGVVIEWVEPDHAEEAIEAYTQSGREGLDVTYDVRPIVKDDDFVDSELPEGFSAISAYHRLSEARYNESRY
jgi:hypothetical protein